MLAIAVIALLLFGPDKLPEMARTVGRVIRQLKKMSEDFTDELKMDFDEPAVHPAPGTEETAPPAPETVGTSAGHDAPGGPEGPEAPGGPGTPSGPALNGHGRVAGELAQREYPPGKEPV